MLLLVVAGKILFLLLSGMASCKWPCPKCQFVFKTLRALRRHAEIYHHCFVGWVNPLFLPPKHHQRLDAADKSLSVTGHGVQGSSYHHRVAVQGHATQNDVLRQCLQPPGNVQLQTFASLDFDLSAGTEKSIVTSINSRLSSLASASSSRSDGAVFNVHIDQHRSSSHCSRLPGVQHVTLPDHSKAALNFPSQILHEHNLTQSVNHQSRAPQAESYLPAPHKTQSSQIAQCPSIHSPGQWDRSSPAHRDVNNSGPHNRRQSPGRCDKNRSPRPRSTHFPSCNSPGLRDRVHSPASHSTHCQSHQTTSNSRGCQPPHSRSPASRTAECPVRQLPGQRDQNHSPPHSTQYPKCHTESHSQCRQDCSETQARPKTSQTLTYSRGRLCQNGSGPRTPCHSPYHRKQNCTVNRSPSGQDQNHSPARKAAKYSTSQTVRLSTVQRRDSVSQSARTNKHGPVPLHQNNSPPKDAVKCSIPSPSRFTVQHNGRRCPAERTEQCLSRRSPSQRDESHTTQSGIRSSSPRVLSHGTVQRNQSHSPVQRSMYTNSHDRNHSPGGQNKNHSPCQRANSSSRSSTSQCASSSSSSSTSQCATPTRSTSCHSSLERDQSPLPYGRAARPKNPPKSRSSPDQRDQRRSASRHTTSFLSNSSQHSSINSNGQLDRSCLPAQCVVSFSHRRHPQASGAASGKHDQSPRYPDRRTSTHSTKSSGTYSRSTHSSSRKRKDCSNERLMESHSKHVCSRDAQNRLPDQGARIVCAGSFCPPSQYTGTRSVGRYSLNVHRHEETARPLGLFRPTPDSYSYEHSTRASHHSSEFVKLEWHKTETVSVSEDDSSRRPPYAFRHLADTFVKRCPLSALETWFAMYPDHLPPATKSAEWRRFSEDHAKVRTVCLSMAQALGEVSLGSLRTGAAHSWLKRFLPL